MSGLFWAGALVFLFLVWSWLDSGAWSTSLTRNVGDRVVGLHQDHGHLQVVFDEDRSSGRVSGWHFSREPLELKESSFGPFPLASALGRKELGLRHWGYRMDRLLVAHWLIVAGHLAGWLGALVLWQRWKRRRRG